MAANATVMRDSAVKLRHDPLPYDPWLLGACAIILGLGLVMVTSASITMADRLHHQPFYFLLRQSAYMLVGLLASLVVVNLPLKAWEKFGPAMLGVGFFLLFLVLVLADPTKGSKRWLAVGPIHIQVSEVVKLLVVVYLAGYLARHGKEVRESVRGFLVPLLVLALLVALLLAEPDFGSSVVLVVTALGMLWLAEVRLRHFAGLFGLVAVTMTLLMYMQPYRIHRLTSFTAPFEDQFNKGFQLSNSLIAFGRGEWTGVGLGSSVQKLFYLPEAHTDFVFAVLAEELGFIGALSVILLFAVVVWRAIQTGRAAEAAGQPFGGYVAYGIGVWIAFQAYVNIGVNMGVLPTKGLTLPLVSFGGSSLIVTIVAVAILVRVHYETYLVGRGGRSEVRAW